MLKVSLLWDEDEVVLAELTFSISIAALKPNELEIFTTDDVGAESFFF